MEYLAALTAEAEEEVERRVANGLTAEERERRELENRADAGDPPRLARQIGIIVMKIRDILRNGSLSARLLPQILEPQQHGQGAFQLAVQVHLVTG